MLMSLVKNFRTRCESKVIFTLRKTANTKVDITLNLVKGRINTRLNNNKKTNICKTL